MNNGQLNFSSSPQSRVSSNRFKVEQTRQKIDNKYALRAYQKDLIARVFASWKKGNRRILLQLATGGGKTILFTDIIKTFISHNFKALVIAHKKELIEQAHGKIKQITGITPGYIKAGYTPNEAASVQVASIQTLIRRNKPPADLLIIDEAHHSAAKSYSDLFEIYSQSLILGVTATPIRNDGQGFQYLYDDLIVGPNTDWLIEMGYLSRFKLFAASIKLAVKEGKKSNKDYSQADLSKAIRENAIVNETAIETWFKYAKKKQTVVFAVNVEHSQKLKGMYRARGIVAEHLDGCTSNAERERIINDFRDKKITVLTNCEIISEGFDVPAIECIQCIRPTKSLALWLQMIGRALRPSDGKTSAIILDHTFNYEVLKLPDIYREWSLYPLSIKKDDHTLECQSCGHVFRPLSHETQDSSQVAEEFSYKLSKVVKLDDGGFKRYYEAKCPVCRSIIYFELGSGGEPVKRSFEAIANLEMVEIENDVYPWFVNIIEQLLRIAKQRNYKQAWIQHQIFDNSTIRKYHPEIPQINLKQLRLKEWRFLAKILGYKKGWAWHRHAETQNIIKLSETEIS
ncbi:MAG: DEAD/DEAH box helicase [Prochloraceae cyanobacterium]